MAELIKDKVEKQKVLKEIIKELHDKSNYEGAKKKFTELIKNVSAEEIAEMEQALINEGLPVSEIHNLCDVHTAVFEDALNKQGKTHKLSGHPIHTFIEENKELKKINKSLADLIKKLKKDASKDSVKKEFVEKFKRLKDINFHYLRKENQLFPYLEKKGFTGPSKVMWAKHDDVRGLFKETDDLITKDKWDEVVKVTKKIIDETNGMIFKEEKILFPTSVNKLTNAEWIAIKNGESHIGYSWIKPGNLWDASLAKAIEKDKTEKAQKEEATKTPDLKDNLALDVGNLSLEQLNLMLVNLPVDISFVDENDKVQFYSNNAERIFPRSPGVIGRDVHNCHPQKSVDVVSKILQSFKNKEKSQADFWINMGGKYIYIRYFALYDKTGVYKGTLEVSQDITEIKALEGERRILDWK